MCVWRPKSIGSKIGYIPTTYANFISLDAILFFLEHTQNFQKAPGGGGVGGYMVNKINTGRDFTCTDNMCKL